MKKVKISTIITSGGNSLRFGKNKLLEKLPPSNYNEKPLTVIETTISKFVNITDEIIIPCKDDVKNFLLKTEIYLKNSDKIKFAPPGSTRQKSVYQGIIACSKPQIVLIHDGARPFIDTESIEKIIKMTYKNKAAVLGKMAVDTIKEVGLNCCGGELKIIKTLNRKTIFHAQTPQGFDYSLIKEIHEKFKNDDSFTDDSSMAEIYGVDVFIVENDKKNTKITVCDDLI